MAVQKNVIKGILAGTFALMLSGCVTVPDAIKGSSPTPQQDLVRVMSAPQLYVGQEARFGGKVVAVQNQQGKTRLEIATVPLDSGARPTLGEPSRGRIYADVNGFLDPVDFRGQLVTVDGAIYGTYPLDVDKEIPIQKDGKTTNLLVIKDGKADVTEADCPDKLCVHQKAISKTNETIVCLPNKVVVQVIGTGESELDSIAR